MTTEAQLATASRRYGPVLDELRAELEEAVDNLLWFDRDDAHLLTVDGRDLIRVGPVSAIGAYMPDLDLDRLTAVLQRLLLRHFGTEPEIDQVNGYLRFVATDARWGGTLTCLIRNRIDSYVDCALEG